MEEINCFSKLGIGKDISSGGRRHETLISSTCVTHLVQHKSILFTCTLSCKNYFEQIIDMEMDKYVLSSVAQGNRTEIK